MQLYLGVGGFSALWEFEPPAWILEIYFSSMLLKIQVGGCFFEGFKHIEDVVPSISCILMVK